MCDKGPWAVTLGGICLGMWLWEAQMSPGWWLWMWSVETCGFCACPYEKTGAMVPRKRFPWLLLSVTIPKCLTRSSSALLGEACLNPIFQSFRLMFSDVLETCGSCRLSKAGELSAFRAGIILRPQRVAKWSSTAASGTSPSWPWGDSLPQMAAVSSRGSGSQNPLPWHREKLF